MTVTRATGWWRRWCLFAAAALLAALLGPLAAAHPAAAQSGGDDVDLPALVPGVLALEDVGVDGMAVSYSGGIGSASQLVASTSFSSDDLDDARDEAIDELDDAGFRRGYEVWWSDSDSMVANYDGDPFRPVTQVAFFAVQFDDEDGAADALAIASDTWEPLDGLDDGIGDETIGHEVTSSFNDVELNGVLLFARTGALVIGVTAQAQDDSDVSGDEQELATGLLTRYVEGVEDLDDLPTDTLGLQMARFGGDGVDPSRDSYLIRDEASVYAFARETAREREDFTDESVDGGVVSTYQLLVNAASEDAADADGFYSIWSDGAVWATEDAAADYVTDQSDIWAGAGSEITDYDDVPSIGDETASFGVVVEDDPYAYSVIAWSEGERSFRIYVQAPDHLASADAIVALAEAQAACAEGFACGDPVDLPDEVYDDAGPITAGAGASDGGGQGDDTTEESDPEASPAGDDETDASPSPAGDDEDADETPVSTGDRVSYESDDYGYALSWDNEAWLRVDDHEPLVGPEGIRLDRTGGGALFIEVDDTRAAGTMDGCLEALSDDVLAEDGIDDVAAAEDEAGDQIAGADDDLAYAGYTLTYEGDEGLNWFACVPIEAGETALTFVYISYDLGDVDGQLADVQDVIDSYEAP